MVRDVRARTAAARCGRRACFTTRTRPRPRIPLTGSTRRTPAGRSIRRSGTGTIQFRTTFQFGPEDKFGASTDIQRHFSDQAFGQLDQGIARIEANAAMCHNDSLTQFTWSRPQSNRLLFEGGGTVGLNTFGTANFGMKLDGSDYETCGQSSPFRVNIADPARGADLSRRRRDRHRRVESVQCPVRDLLRDRRAQRQSRASRSSAATSPATPSTAPRTWADCPISYTFNNGVPTSMTLFASRNNEAHLNHDLSLFAQDQWTLQPLDPERRPAFRLAAAQRVARRRQPGQRAVPGVQLAGGRTTCRTGAISTRASARPTTCSGTARPRSRAASTATSPARRRASPRRSVRTANFSTARNWTDANGNFFPDCDLKNAAAQDLRGRRR